MRSARAPPIHFTPRRRRRAPRSGAPDRARTRSPARASARSSGGRERLHGHGSRLNRAPRPTRFHASRRQPARRATGGATRGPQQSLMTFVISASAVLLHVKGWPRTVRRLPCSEQYGLFGIAQEVMRELPVDPTDDAVELVRDHLAIRVELGAQVAALAREIRDIQPRTLSAFLSNPNRTPSQDTWRLFRLWWPRRPGAEGTETPKRGRRNANARPDAFYDGILHALAAFNKASGDLIAEVQAWRDSQPASEVTPPVSRAKLDATGQRQLAKDAEDAHRRTGTG